MRKIILLLLLVAIALPTDAFASIHGVLKGRVVDMMAKVLLVQVFVSKEQSRRGCS
jgi:hypothetical protein